MRKRTAIAAALLLLTGSIVAGDRPNHVQYDTDLIPPSEYRARRDSVKQMIGMDAAAIFFASPERTRNGDVSYLYRQSDDLYYLTGFTEPNAILLLAPKGVTVMASDSTRRTVTEILFVQERDASKERWTGRRYGPEGAMELIGMEYAMINDQFRTMLRKVLFSRLTSLYAEPITSDVSGELRDLLAPLQNWIDRKKEYHSMVELRDPTPTVNRMRIIKSPAEIEIIAKASKISALAHRQAMMSVEPGMHEYDLQAIYQYVFQRMGAEYTGYPCIDGAGENSVILHYESNRKKIENGEICLNDCAAEYHGYSSDVTRSFPANGMFSKEQRAIYQVVYRAQSTAIGMMKPGTTWTAISSAADSVLEEGLLSLGLMKQRSLRELRRFYPHGLGHPVGLNVHDVGQDTLQPGMLNTVEPGIYIADGMEGVDPKFYNIGIRIEDVVLVTPEGPRVLSADAPREIAEIEALMKKKGIGNQPLQ